MKEYLNIANDPVLWLMAVPAVAMVAIQAWIFSKRSFDASELAGLTKHQCRQAFRVGAVSAIGPSLAVFIVMIGMMAVVGAPITWLRLSFIGAAPTELTATTVGAKAMGIDLGSAEYGLTAFASSVWTMTLNGCGWLVFCGLFTHQLDKVMDKVTGGSMALMTTVCGAAVLGTSGYLATDHAFKGVPNFAAVIAAAITMVILLKVSEKIPKIKEYNLGIAMIAGMIAAVIAL